LRLVSWGASETFTISGGAAWGLFLQRTERKVIAW
jgi:hypothetical protein